MPEYWIYSTKDQSSFALGSFIRGFANRFTSSIFFHRSQVIQIDATFLDRLQLYLTQFLTLDYNLRLQSKRLDEKLVGGKNAQN